MTWRSPKLLLLVRSLPCTWPLPHECAGAVEPAHSNQLRDGKGMRHKAADYRIAALCHASHVEVDQGARYSKDERREAWEIAHRATIGLLFERGIVRVV